MEQEDFPELTPRRTSVLPSADAAPLPAGLADARGRRIGILIVAYNALTTVNKVLDRIPGDVWDNVEEVVVFDDASKDATYELALGYKASRGNQKLHVLRHALNLGYGGNQKAGYRYFLDKGFDAVVLLHGDGQYAPEILAQLYHPIVAGEADAVFGSRMMMDYGGPLKGGMPLYKFVGNKILTTLENYSLGMHLTEFHSGYRAYSLHALRRIEMENMTNDFHFDTEIIIKLNHQGFRIAEVPIPTYYGEELCYVDGMKYARDVARAVRRYRRTAGSIESFPEFQEYFVHYPIKETPHSSHAVFLATAGTGHRILEVGCGEGFFAAQLAARGNQVTGVDVLPVPKHAEAFAEYHSADLSRGFGPALERLRGQPFDKILLMDVIEHLEKPEQLLAECRELMDPQSRLLVSVPNVANFTVRLAMLFGRFNYTERGILDKTHLRFFTRKTARRLLESCGFTIEKQDYTIIPIELVLGLSPRNLLVRLLNPFVYGLTRLWPGLFAYQLVYWGKSRPAS
jgi:2-polyprenyl-3-methyl-5-hydroxy-6-metoxy-1,4-benzoquinol methylase